MPTRQSDREGGNHAGVIGCLWPRHAFDLHYGEVAVCLFCLVKLHDKIGRRGFRVRDFNLEPRARQDLECACRGNARSGSDRSERGLASQLCVMLSFQPQPSLSLTYAGICCKRGWCVEL